MNPWILGGIAIAIGAAVGVAVYASKPLPPCPTELQKKKAFDDVKSGSLTAAGAKLVADAWDKSGCHPEAEALRMAARGEKAPLLLTGPIHIPPKATSPTGTGDDGLGGSPKIPGTTIPIPSSFPTNPHKDAPAYNCDYSSGGRDAAVLVVMATSGSSTASKEMADMLTVFAQQLAFCGHMADATTVGKRAILIRESSGGVAGVSGYRPQPASRARRAPPWMQGRSRRAG